jgi:hypothetical protein
LESIVKKFNEHKLLKEKIKEIPTKLLKSVKWMRVLGLGFKKVVLPTAAAYLTGSLSLMLFLLQEFSQFNVKELVTV